MIKAAFPEAKIIASPGTIKDINATKTAKSPIGADPERQRAETVIVPQPLQGDSFTIDGQKVEVKGLNGPTPIAPSCGSGVEGGRWRCRGRR